MVENAASEAPIKRVQVSNLLAKKNSEKISCLTAYDYRTAQILDATEIDLILVGDSLANVFLGLDDTYQIGMPEMIYHTKAVARGVKRAFLATDMPFLSYQLSIDEALRNASELMKAGAKGVKIEGADPHILKVIEKLVNVGIPVIGHLGYTPQSAGVLGKGRIQGKTQSAAQEIFINAKELESAGAFAVVLEMIPKDLAAKITESIQILTIGIGAGVSCDGQILVTDDLLGKGLRKLKFAKRYSEQAEDTSNATKQFINEVKNSIFPNDSQSFILDI